MKKRFISIFISCIFPLSLFLLVSSCPSSYNLKSSKPDITTETLPGGEILTIISPVPVSITIIEDPSGYPAGSKVSAVSIEGTLGTGQTAEISYMVDSGFEVNDKIAFVDTSGKWFPVFSTRSGDKKSVSAIVDHFSIWGVIHTSYIIVDHTAVQMFDQIPEYWLEQAKELTFHYGHTSHGSQILAGLQYIEENIDAVKYSVSMLTYQPTPPPLPSEEDPPALRISAQGAWPHDYWESQDGIDNTRRTADTGLFNFSMWAWCSQVSDWPTEKIQEYLDTMNMFEQEYPEMRFIYMTGHRSNNPYELIHNEMIREHCRNNDKILFDFADIESWDPDGNYYPETTDQCEWAKAWCVEHPDECIDLPPFCDSGIPECCAHSHGYNCYIKGKAFWYMMARLAGWDGQPQ